MKVAVLGLGEAGSRIAADLASRGDEVRGHDPGEVATPPGVERHSRPETTVAGCRLVLAVAPASQAREVLLSVIGSLGDDVVYADLCTAAPRLKEELASIAADRGVMFADVAVMSPILGHGVAAPALVSGAGADVVAELLNARGGNVQAVGERAGEAATRKLLRSVMMKGLAALLVESMQGAEQLGQSEWLWSHLVEQLGSIDEPMMKRLLFDTAPHATRRLEEMEAARELLKSLHVPADMTEATIGWLSRIAGEGMPKLPLRR